MNWQQEPPNWRIRQALMLEEGEGLQAKLAEGLKAKQVEEGQREAHPPDYQITAGVVGVGVGAVGVVVAGRKPVPCGAVLVGTVMMEAVVVGRDGRPKHHPLVRDRYRGLNMLNTPLNTLHAEVASLIGRSYHAIVLAIERMMFAPTLFDVSTSKCSSYLWHI